MAELLGDDPRLRLMDKRRKIRKRRENESAKADNVLKLLEEMIKNDPTNKRLQFIEGGAKKRGLQLLSCLAGQSHGGIYWPRIQ